MYSSIKETMKNNKATVVSSNKPVKEPIMMSVNKNAGEIQQLKEEIDGIKNTFNSVKPLQEDVETHFNAIINLRNNAAVKKAQDRMKEK